jgi:hypothetical protein
MWHGGTLAPLKKLDPVPYDISTTFIDRFLAFNYKYFCVVYPSPFDSGFYILYLCCTHRLVFYVQVQCGYCINTVRGLLYAIYNTHGGFPNIILTLMARNWAPGGLFITRPKAKSRYNLLNIILYSNTAFSLL